MNVSLFLKSPYGSAEFFRELFREPVVVALRNALQIF
jgi:hypothetical protein